MCIRDSSYASLRTSRFDKTKTNRNKNPGSAASTASKKSEQDKPAAFDVQEGPEQYPVDTQAIPTVESSSSTATIRASPELSQHPHNKPLENRSSTLSTLKSGSSATKSQQEQRKNRRASLHFSKIFKSNGSSSRHSSRTGVNAVSKQNSCLLYTSRCV